MISRRIISAVALSLLALASIFSELLYVVTVIGLVTLGLYEFFSLVERKGIPIYKYFGTIIGIVIPLSIYFKFELTKGWEFLFVTVALISLFILQFSRTQSDNAVVAIATTMFGIFYISWLFSFMIKIRILDHGMALAGCLLLVTKGADIGAFLVGIRWGKHSLIPKISPKKTVEGVLGGIVFGVCGALVSKSFLPAWPIFSFANLVLLGVALSLLGLLGDLSESLIKRDCAAKDSSYIFPGMGGIMDVIDSLLFTAPAFYFFIHYYTSRAFSGPTVF